MKFAIALTLVLQTYAHTDASLDDLDITSFDSPDLDFREDFDDEKSDDESNDSEDSSNEATPVASPKKENQKNQKQQILINQVPTMHLLIKIIRHTQQFLSYIGQFLNRDCIVQL